MDMCLCCQAYGSLLYYKPQTFSVSDTNVQTKYIGFVTPDEAKLKNLKGKSYVNVEVMQLFTHTHTHTRTHTHTHTHTQTLSLRNY